MVIIVKNSFANCKSILYFIILMYSSACPSIISYYANTMPCEKL